MTGAAPGGAAPTASWLRIAFASMAPSDPAAGPAVRAVRLSGCCIRPEAVVLGYDTGKCDLLRAVLPQPATVAFLGDSSLYATPACAIEAHRHEFERHLSAGAEQIRIAGDVPHEGNGGRFAGWDRYESAVNAVWEDYPVWSRCLYGATTVSDDVRDVVERTHRRLVAPDGSAA